MGLANIPNCRKLHSYAYYKEVEDDGINVTNRLFGARVPEMGSYDVIMICKSVQFYANFI